MNPAVESSLLPWLILASALAAGLALAVAVLWRRLRRQQRGGAAASRSRRPTESRLPPLAEPGWLDRGAFEARLIEAARNCDRHQRTLALLFLDVDDFTRVNHAIGHRQADDVLRDIAGRVHVATPHKLGATRLGGDEFLVLVECDVGSAQNLARHLLHKLAEPIAAAGNVELSASIGIAVYPQHGAAARLPALANTAMRSVKQAGGNAFALFDPQLEVEQRQRAALVADLRHAVKAGQLELFYQPKIDAATLQITAAEALLRWRHPTLGVISPSVFVPLAERHGLIGEIGNWVIEDAARQAGRWRELGLRMRVAINLSPYQMRQDDLVKRIEIALRDHRLHPQRFTVEITESLALENTQATQRTFERLRRAGLHVAIDDFGAGQTSLAYLRNLPASELKLDMSLVQDLETSAEARAIAEAVIKLAHTLERRVVAEGVESVAQRDWLVAAGCDELQGFLFARPMSARALGMWALDAATNPESAFKASLFTATRQQAVTQPMPMPTLMPTPGQPAKNAR